MARVSNVELSVGRAASGLEFAEVSYDIEFSTTEQDLNLRFAEVAMLFERDSALDTFVEQMGVIDFGLAWLPKGNLDDFVGEIFNGSVRPDGEAVVHREHRREWSFPDNEDGREEYRAFILVIPEIRRASAWSNEVSINLA
jgi:hypothetical protein